MTADRVLVTMLERWERTFGGNGGDYIFTMSHISVSGEGIEASIEKGEWVLTQRKYQWVMPKDFQ